MKNRPSRVCVRSAAKLVLLLLLVLTLAFGLFPVNAEADVVVTPGPYSLVVGQPCSIEFYSDSGANLNVSKSGGAFPNGLSETGLGTSRYTISGVVGPGSVTVLPCTINVSENTPDADSRMISISVSKGPQYIEQIDITGTVGGTAQLTRTAKDYGRNEIPQGSLDAPTLTYNSDDTSIATVSNTGLVTFLKAGATTVLIESAATGSYAEAAPKPVNVAISPASPTISVADAAVKQGEPVAITATLANAYLKSGDSIQFELSGGGLTLPATARANGSFVFNLSAADTKLLGKGIHDLTIRQSGTGGAAATNNTAVSDATFQLTVTENVAPPTPVPTVAPRVITNKAPVITSADRYACPAETGGTFQVSATGKPDKFRYSLDSAPDGVSINATSGLMSVAGTVAADTYTFSVNADNGVNPIAVQNFTLTVEAPAVDPALLNTPSPLRIQGQPKGGSLHVGDVITLNLEGEAEFQTGSKGWTWDSQYFDASFDGSATFTALQTGTTIIRYTAADGQVVSATIDILEKEEPVQPAGPTDDTGVSPWLWVGLAAGLVLIGLVLLWFLIRRRRRQTG